MEMAEVGSGEIMTKKDWCEAGDQIRNLVQEAIDSKDYSQLSSTISNVVNQTMGGLEDVLKDTVDGLGEALKDSLGAEDGKREGARSQGDNGSNAQNAGASDENQEWENRPYQRWVRQTRTEAAEEIRKNVEAERIRRNKEHENRKNEKKKSTSLTVVKAPGQVSGAVMKWVGYTGSGMFGLSLAILGVVAVSTGIGLTLPIGILAVLFGGSFWLGTAGSKKQGLASRFRKYRAVLGERTYCMVEELADSIGESSKFVKKDLKKMIRRGFFPQGYLDQKETCLITDRETYQQYLAAQQSYTQRKESAQKEAPKTEEKDETAKAHNPACEDLIRQGRSYILHIRECNDRIPDETMSEKLERLELVVTRIFTEAERNPEVADDLKKMMSYYLPTTKKLLDAYCNLNEQPVSGQNIANTKREIENALDTLNAAFEKLLDDLFEEQAWDISSDISVLNTMLAQEGLTGNAFERSMDNPTL